MSYVSIFLAAWAGVWCADRLSWKDVHLLAALPLFLWDKVRGRA